MSEQHPNPKNKIPGKNASGGIHNVGRTKLVGACRSASSRERFMNSTMEPPNRAGRTIFRAQQRAKAKK